MSEEVQGVEGRIQACCPSMKMALSTGYILKGFLWCKPDPPTWLYWRFKIQGKGFIETSPIHFCPFCGGDLDSK